MMYSPLNEQYMFQEMHDRVAAMQPAVRTEAAARRRWRKAARRAR